MFTLIEMIEGQGRRGGPIALVIAALTAAGSVGCVVRGLDSTGWTMVGLFGAAFALAAATMVFAMLGSRLLTAPLYPSPEESFPSLPADEFEASMYAAQRPLAACADCRIYVPAQFDTGACPRCSSSMGWSMVEKDEDAELVITAMRR